MEEAREKIFGNSTCEDFVEDYRSAFTSHFLTMGSL